MSARTLMAEREQARAKLKEQLNNISQMSRMARFFSALWQFCSYLFVPQWGRKH